MDARRRYAKECLIFKGTVLSLNRGKNHNKLYELISYQIESDQYYNSMWKAVQAEKETGGKQAEDFYIKSSVITDKRQKNRFLKSGIIYRNEKIRDYMNKEHFLKMLTRIAHSVA